MDFAADYTLTIDGKALNTAARMPVFNPATGQPFAQVPVATAEVLDLAVGAAERAFPGWKAMGLEGRRERLIAAATAMEAHVDELARLFVQEQGRPYDMAKAEVELSAYWIRAVAQQEIKEEIIEESDARTVVARREPLGVVAAIVPWNFPLLLAVWKIAPALITGNTMVLKPSPYTPLCALRLAELWRDILPAGVLNVITGENDLGASMTVHPGIAKISFTGSTATGKRVMAAAAGELTRLTLELGGNDAAIILPDVDVNAVAQKLFFGAFYNTAQVCIATKRMYIHEAIYDEMREALLQLARNCPVGDGLEKDIVFGPVQNKAQFDHVNALIAEAREQGLQLLQGCDVPNNGGYFIPLTLVDNPPEDARVVKEEAFGPVLPLLKFSDIDDVVERVNASEYGLAGAVWSADIPKAVELANRLETGTVWINDNLQTAPHIPFGGIKQSGFGVENGIEGVLEYTWRRVLFIPKSNVV